MASRPPLVITSSSGSTWQFQSIRRRAIWLRRSRSPQAEVLRPRIPGSWRRRPDRIRPRGRTGMNRVVQDGGVEPGLQVGVQHPLQRVLTVHGRHRHRRPAVALGPGDVVARLGPDPDQVHVLQVPVGLGDGRDGGPLDPAHLPERRQAVAGLEDPRLDQVADLLGDLLVERRSGSHGRAGKVAGQGYQDRPGPMKQGRPPEGAPQGGSGSAQPFFLTKASMYSTRVLTLSTVTAL